MPPAETAADRLRELLAAVPFVPFTVHLHAGPPVEVDGSDVWTDCICTGGGRPMRIWLRGRRLSPAGIAAIEPAGKEPT
jgi:hypothetical protein